MINMGIYIIIDLAPVLRHPVAYQKVSVSCGYPIVDQQSAKNQIDLGKAKIGFSSRLIRNFCNGGYYLRDS